MLVQGEQLLYYTLHLQIFIKAENSSILLPYLDHYLNQYLTNFQNLIAKIIGMQENSSHLAKIIAIGDFGDL